MKCLFLLCSTILATTVCIAQPAPIRDNSFLIEEAYNQEKGVFQNILLFQFDRAEEDDARDYLPTGSFTQEWPLGGPQHQFSYTIPFRLDGPFRFIENMWLNYRYQVEAGPVFLAPRLSLQIPLSSAETGGLRGYQVFLPCSWEPSNRWSIHMNGGYGYSTNSFHATDDRIRLHAVTLGTGINYNLSAQLNLVVETLWLSDDLTVSHKDGDIHDRLTAWVVNPGFRMAINFPNYAQLVLGCSAPASFNSETDSWRLGGLFYISYEAFFRRES